MSVFKYILKFSLYLLVFLTLLFLAVFTCIFLWLNEYTYNTSTDTIGHIETSDYVQNIDGSKSFKIKITKENQISNIEHLLNPDNKGITSESEYLVSGSMYSVQVLKIKWSNLFKSLGLNDSLKMILLKTSYEPELISKNYPTDSFVLDGGVDEFLKSLSNSPDLARFFVDSIVYETLSYKYTDSSGEIFVK